MKKIDWEKAIKPLLKKYHGKKHPLDYKNNYQLLVMVVLSAQTTDDLINAIAPDLFKAFPDMASLAKAKPEKFKEVIAKVRNNNNKTNWLIEIAKSVKTDANIPKTLNELTALKGIGRKSANVIMRGMKVEAEGVIVDLHVIRVANRLGIAKGEKGEEIEEQIMKVIPQKEWGEVGMAISFLGRQTCRPTNPKHADCVMQDVCDYFQKQL